MDVYHKPEIFVRRMLYKPNWWKDYFNPEQVHWQSSILPVRDSTIFWDIPVSKQINEDATNNNNMTSIQQKKNIIEIENNLKNIQLKENTPPKKQLIKVKMLDMASKEKTEIINIKKSKENNNNNSECIFQENKSKPLSPIYSTIDKRLKQRNNLKKEKTPPRQAVEQNSTWQRILGLENVPFTSAEGKIIKDLVLERFEANKLNKENEASSKNLQEIINRFNNNNNNNSKSSLNPPPQTQKESFQRNITLSDEENCSPAKLSCKIQKMTKDINENFEPISLKKVEDINLQTTRLLYPKLSPLKSFYHHDSDSEKNLSSLDSNLSSSEHLSSSPIYQSVETDFSDGNSFRQEVPSFDADKFLGEALGDEFYSSVSTTGNCGQKSIPPLSSNNTNNNNGGMIECTSLSYNEIQSVCTAEASDLLSHRDIPSSTINIKYSIKTNTSLEEESSHDGSSNDDSSNTSNNSSSNSNRLNSNDKKIMYLMQQAAEQHYHMQQASKALSICRITKEFTFSEERLEAERLLLLAVLKNRAILEEINRMDHENTFNENYQQGNLTISNIRVPITRSNSDSIHKKFCNFSQWYLCIGIYGSQLHCSKIKTSNAENELHFDEPMSFVKLPPDFVLDLYIYYLEQPKNIRNFSHTSKYHLDTAYKCPTPRKLFKKHVYNKTTTVSRTSLNDYIRTPSFKLAGHIKLDMNNLNSMCHRDLKSVHRYLHGTIYMEIATNLQIYVKCSGFLTFGSEAGGYPSWNRHWCSLDGHYLKFWNYPSDADVKNPIGVIDLKKCITPWIESASEEICSKPRTLLIETARPKGPEDRNSLIMECIDNQTIIRYLLSCDTDSDLKKWSKQLNLVVTFLKIWNLLDHS